MYMEPTPKLDVIKKIKESHFTLKTHSPDCSGNPFLRLLSDILID